MNQRCAGALDFRSPPPHIFGIVNLTRDSFSDGGRHLAPDAAVAHACDLLRSGADGIDLGAESTHPDAQDVPDGEQIARLTPVIERLRASGTVISVDTYKPAVMRAVLRLGVQCINDVTALRDPDSVAVLRDSDARVVLMHSRSRGPRAEQDANANSAGGRSAGSDRIVEEIIDFFQDRIAALEAAGIQRRRLILDPGMGLFLGRDPRTSLRVLHDLPRLRGLGLPLLVSTSRKSFLGATLATPADPRPVDRRASGTLASELWAAHVGVDYVRTHEVAALADGLKVWRAIASAGRPE